MTTADTCRVYWNIHRKQWSVQRKGPKGWRVALTTPALALAECSFSVSQAGRNRVLREKRKNVHAFVVGKLLASGSSPSIEISGAQPVTYSPYRAGHFYLGNDTAKRIEAAYFALFTPDRKVFCAIAQYARILVVPVVITKETARCALSSETPS